MTTVFMRELVVLSQRRPFAVAVAIFVTATLSFTMVWPSGIPLYTGATLFPQFTLLQQLTLAVMAPWIVCRCGTRERGNSLVYLSLFCMTRPSRIMLARFAACTVAIIAMAVAGLPGLVYAQQVSAVEAPGLAVAFVEISLTGATAVAWTLAVEQSVRSYVGGWLTATATSVALLVAAVSSEDNRLAISALLLSAVCFVVVVLRADGASRYLAEEHA